MNSQRIAFDQRKLEQRVVRPRSLELRYPLNRAVANVFEPLFVSAERLAGRGVEPFGHVGLRWHALGDVEIDEPHFRKRARRLSEACDPRALRRRRFFLGGLDGWRFLYRRIG